MTAQFITHQWLKHTTDSHLDLFASECGQVTPAVCHLPLAVLRAGSLQDYVTAILCQNFWAQTHMIYLRSTLLLLEVAAI